MEDNFPSLELLSVKTFTNHAAAQFVIRNVAFPDEKCASFIVQTTSVVFQPPRDVYYCYHEFNIITCTRGQTYWQNTRKTYAVVIAECFILFWVFLNNAWKSNVPRDVTHCWENFVFPEKFLLTFWMMKNTTVMT